MTKKVSKSNLPWIITVHYHFVVNAPDENSAVIRAEEYIVQNGLDQEARFISASEVFDEDFMEMGNGDD